MEFIDDVHMQMALSVTDERLQPFVYLLSKRLMESSTCLELDSSGRLADLVIEELPEAFRKTFLQPQVDPYTVLQESGNSWLALNPDTKRPFILSANKLYFYRFFNYEKLIVDKLKEIINTQSDDDFRSRGKKLIDFSSELTNDYFSKPQFSEKEDLADWQLAAAFQSFQKKFMIITGGPGTGKTTTIYKILRIISELLPESKTKIAMAAPTGKAANRMKQSLNEKKVNFENLLMDDPMTIHRLLGISQFNIHGKYANENKLDYDVVIIDEASMIDTSLFAKLVMAIPSTSHLILLGDKNQLASVEAGSLFGDLCSSRDTINKIEVQLVRLLNSKISQQEYKIPETSILTDSNHLLAGHIIELRYNYRFRAQPKIGQFSRAVLESDLSGIQAIIKDKDDESLIIDTEYTQKHFENFASQYINYIKLTDNAKALTELNKVKVLCAVREGEQGVYKVNRRIENFLKEKIKDRNLFSPNDEMYHNRPIMVTRNYYDLDLFNGDIGLIRKVDGVLKALFLDQNDTVRIINPALIPEVETVFAMTIHKSQGSEFDEVLVVLPQNEENRLLTKELLYTAVTRAKNKVLIQGSEDIILQSSALSVRRSSGIAHRLIK